MTRVRTAIALALAVVTVCGYSVKADVRADQKTLVQLGGMLGRMANIFGGKGAREGVTSTVAVKGDRKATSRETSGQIIDLNEEKIYDLDMKRKTYKVTTFAELRQKMEEAQKKAQEAARRERTDKPSTPERDPNAKEMEVDFDVKNTGEKKAINGFDTHQVIMTITLREKGKKLEEGGGMVVTSDMWLTPTIAAMKEINEFDRRYAAKLAGPTLAGASAEELASAMAMYPMMKQAIGRMSTEGAKMDGTAILTTVTFSAVASAEQAAQEAKDTKQSDDEKSSSGGGGLLGGLAKKIAQKRSGGQNENKEEKGRATIMTSTTEILKVAPAVEAADVAVPAGFKEGR